MRAVQCLMSDKQETKRKHGLGADCWLKMGPLRSWNENARSAAQQLVQRWVREERQHTGSGLAWYHGGLGGENVAPRRAWLAWEAGGRTGSDLAFILGAGAPIDLAAKQSQTTRARTQMAAWSLGACATVCARLPRSRCHAAKSNHKRKDDLRNPGNGSSEDDPNDQGDIAQAGNFLAAISPSSGSWNHGIMESWSHEVVSRSMGELYTAVAASRMIARNHDSSARNGSQSGDSRG